jgi:plasmid stabilization system protein ParE
MIVVITDEAEADLERIGDHIAGDNPQRAISFVREPRRRCESLSNMPKRFPLAPRCEHTGIRRCVHGDYLIFYRVRRESIDVIRVLHGAMHYESMLFPES